MGKNASRWLFAKASISRRPWMAVVAGIPATIGWYKDCFPRITAFAKTHGYDTSGVSDVISAIPFWVWATISLIAFLAWIFEAMFRAFRDVANKHARLVELWNDKQSPRLQIEYERSIFVQTGGDRPARKVLQVKVTNPTLLTLRGCQILAFSEPSGSERVVGNSATPWPASDTFTLRPSESRDIPFAAVVSGDVAALSVNHYRQEGERYVPLEVTGYRPIFEVDIQLSLVADGVQPIGMNLVGKPFGNDWILDAKSDTTAG